MDEEPRRLKFAFDYYFFWKFFFSILYIFLSSIVSLRLLLETKLDFAIHNYASHSDNLVDGIFSPRLKKSLQDQIWIKSRYTGFLKIGAFNNAYVSVSTLNGECN